MGLWFLMYWLERLPKFEIKFGGAVVVFFSFFVIQKMVGLCMTSPKSALVDLSIFLYVLTPEWDIRRVPRNQVLGVSFCFLLVFVQC